MSADRLAAAPVGAPSSTELADAIRRALYEVLGQRYWSRVDMNEVVDVIVAEVLPLTRRP